MQKAFGFALVLLCLAAVPSIAEEARFPVERFRPAIDNSGIIDVDSGSVGGHLSWNVAGFANYALNPLVLQQDGQRSGALVAHRVGLDVTAALSLFEWVQLGIDVPLLLFQTRDTASLASAVLDATDISAVGIGDFRLLSKVRILRQQDQFVDLAVIPAITVPTGFPVGDTGNYVGEGQLTFAPELALSRRFGVGSAGGLKLAANIGYRLRPAERQVVNVTIGHELTYRAGVGYRLGSLPLEIGVTANGGTYAFQPFSSGFEENPLELMGGVSYDVMPFLHITGGVGKGILSGFGTPDFRAFVGVRYQAFDDDQDDDGIKDTADRCKQQPEDKDGWQDSDGCPDPDNDQDQILDGADGAPNDPEDRDGFQDNDGVPDPDNDDDGILDNDDQCPMEPGVVAYRGCPIPDADGDGVLDPDDACVNLAGPPVLKGCPDSDGDGFIDPNDKCPNEAETVNNIDDDDGCPDKGDSKVKLTREKIEILDKVYFDVNKDTIQTRSFDLLNQVASVLRAHGELTRVRVEGHTDSDGKDDKNLNLSNRRAAAVKKYLVDRGVEGRRLDAIGYGESRPVAPNTNKANKEKNRRVEFVIVELDGKPIGEPAAATAIPGKE